jgi:hypothetical protein
MADPRADSQLDTIATICGWTVEAILADPLQLDRLDRHSIEFCVKNRAALEPGLLQRAVDFDAKGRLRLGMHAADRRQATRGTAKRSDGKAPRGCRERIRRDRAGE